MKQTLVCALTATLVAALGACGAASHSAPRAKAPAAVQAMPVAVSFTAPLEPQAQLDATPITPVESAGASQSE